MKRSLSISRVVFIFLIGAFAVIATGAPLASSWGIPKKVQYGTIMGAFPFSTDGSHSGGGMMVGAILGSSIGLDNQPFDNTAVSLAGIAGAAVGMMIEKSVNSERLVQVHILMDDGREAEVTQYSRKRKFRLHDEVKVLYFNNGKKLVYHRDEPVEWETNPYIFSGNTVLGTKLP